MRHTRSMRPTTPGATTTGSSTQGIKTVLYPIADRATAEVVHTTLLGAQPQTDYSYHLGMRDGSWLI